MCYFKNGQDHSILIENGRLDVPIQMKTNRSGYRYWHAGSTSIAGDFFVLQPSPIIPSSLHSPPVGCCRRRKVLKTLEQGFSHTASLDSIGSRRTIKPQNSLEEGTTRPAKFETERKMFVCTDRHLFEFVCVLVICIVCASGDYGMCKNTISRKFLDESFLGDAQWQNVEKMFQIRFRLQFSAKSQLPPGVMVATL